MDAAIELAGHNDAALAALLERVQEVRKRNAVAAGTQGSDSAAAASLSAGPRA